MNPVARWLWYLLPANPMVVRIVQGGSRRVRDLWVRMGYLGALIVLVLIGLMSAEGLGADSTLTDLAKAGTKVFAFVAYGQVILVCLLAPVFMAGAITSERQNETFDILLTTPLSNLQIVLGTLAGRLYFILALLMSGLPLFAVLLIFGGVPVLSVFVAFAVAALSALFVGSVAVTLSVLRTGGRKAVFLFIIVVVGYLVAAFAADRIMRAAQRSPGSTAVDSTTWLTPLHPLLVLEASVNQANYRAPAAEDLADRGTLMRFYHSQPLGAYAMLTVLLSTLMLVFSATQVRRLSQGLPMIPLPQGVRRLLRLDAGERSRPARNVWHNPIAWREANTRGNRVGGLLGRGVFAVVGLGAAAVLIVLFHNDSLPKIAGTAGAMARDQGSAFRMGLTALLLLELAVIVIVALYMSAGSISKEREDGTLDLLLATPITPQYYIRGKLRGLVSYLATMIAVPVLTMAMASVYSMLAGGKAVVTNYVGTGVYPGPLVFPEAMLLLPLLIVPFVAACVTIGILQSIQRSSVIAAVVWSVGYVGLWATVWGFCGSNAATSVEVIGPIANSFSPVTNVIMLVDPWQVKGFAGSEAGGRANLIVAALVAALGYGTFVYLALHATVASFDHTVRKLSGAA